MVDLQNQKSRSGKWSSKWSYWEFIILNGLLFAQNAIALDVFLPVLSDISLEFNLSDPNTVQQTFSICFLGFAFSQLIYAPLSDSLGRRALLLLGSAIMLIGGIMVVFANSFTTLLVARFIQGFGMGAGRTVNLSALRDCFQGRELGRAMSNMYMVFSLIPIIAPLLGYLFGLISWRVVAVIPVLFNLLIGGWIWFRYPETLPVEKRSRLSLFKTLENFKIVLKNKKTLLYTLAAGTSFASILQILLQVTAIGEDIYQMPFLGPTMLALIAITMTVTSRLSAKFVISHGMRFISQFTLLFMLTFSLVLLALVSFMPLPVWLIVILLQAIGGTLAGCLANFQALALEPHEKLAGVAAAITGAGLTFIATILSAFLASFYDGTLFPLAFGLVLVFTLCLMIVLIAERGRLFLRELS